MGNADAVVVHLHPNPFAAGTCGDHNGAPVRGVFNGVGHNIHHYLDDALPVRQDLRQGGRQAQRDSVVVLLGIQQDGLIGVPDGLTKGESGEIQPALARVEPRQGEQVLDDVGHPVRLPQNDR